MHMGRQHPPLKTHGGLLLQRCCKLKFARQCRNMGKVAMLNQIMGLAPIGDNTNAKALDPPTPHPLQVSRTCGFPGLPEPVASIAGAVGQRAKPKLAAEHSHQTYKLQAPPSPHPSLRLTNCEMAGNSAEVPRRGRRGQVRDILIKKGNCEYTTVTKSIPLHLIHT